MGSRIRRWSTAVLAGSLVALVVGSIPSAGARMTRAATLTQAQCAALVAEGAQARDDLAKLLESQGSGGATATTTPEIASYVAGLLRSASTNIFGFVSAGAGQPLDVCLPKGSTRFTLFSTPVVLWEGLATTDPYPVTVIIPGGTTCGTHTFQATGEGVDQSVQSEVTGACSTRTTGPLPRTGVEIGRYLAVALALIAVGYAVVTARRTRRVSR